MEAVISSRQRRLETLELLRSNPVVHGPSLCRLFGVNPRTVIRDMIWLRKQGHLIDGERGRGYMLRRKPILTPCPHCGRVGHDQ